MKRDILVVLSTALCVIIAQVYGVSELEWPDCATDSCVFAQCEKDLGRPCTDEDVFGKPCEEVECDGPCSDLPPDHPDYCEGSK